MSAPVDVLAILDAHAGGIAEAAKRARGQNREEIQAGHAEFVEARAAVAELIDASREYQGARDAYGRAQGMSDRADKAELWRAVCRADARLTEALARVGGAS